MLYNIILLKHQKKKIDFLYFFIDIFCNINKIDCVATKQHRQQKEKENMIDFNILYKIRKTGSNYLAICQGIIDSIDTLSHEILNSWEYFLVSHRDKRDYLRKREGKILEFPENIIPLNIRLNKDETPRLFSFLYKSQIK